MTLEPNDEKEKRDDVATLIRLGGPRPAVPPQRLDRARAAARASWRQAVQRRSRSRNVWAVALTLAASLVLAVTVRVIWFENALPLVAESAIRVESLSGQVWIRTPADPDGAPRRALKLGDEVSPGCELVTAERGRTALRLSSGHSVRLDESTRIRLLDVESIALDRGAVYVDSGSDVEAAGTLAIHTQFGVVEEIGTQFEVRLADDAVHVRLREGAVVVQRDGESHAVAAGNELELRSDGSTTVREIATHGAGWDWIAGIAPMLELEGRTAREFLAWVGRERGLRVVFADEAVARAAGETVLRGTARGLSLEEALDAVLPTCRMVHRIDDGMLTIYADPGERSAP